MNIKDYTAELYANETANALLAFVLLLWYFLFLTSLFYGNEFTAV